MVKGVLLFVYFSSIRIKNCIYATHYFYYFRLSTRKSGVTCCVIRMKKGAEGASAACAGRFVNGCERDPQATNWCETGVKRIRGLIRKRVRTRVRNGYTGRCAGRCKTKQARERAREYECETDASVREGARGKVHVRKAHAP